MIEITGAQAVKTDSDDSVNAKRSRIPANTKHPQDSGSEADMELDELLNTLIIPDKAHMEERTIVLDDADAYVGSHVNMGYGIIARSIITGERVKIGGNIEGAQDVRIDMWSEVSGSVKCGLNAYIGEYVKIGHKLFVKGDLDIGNDVQIGGGFEAKGWISIRNPLPIIIYIIIYLAELFRLGRGEEAEKLLEELFEDEEAETANEWAEGKVLIIPAGADITYNMMRVSGRAFIGSGCRLIGNVRSTSMTMGDENLLFGGIQTRDEMMIGGGNTIHGDLTSRGSIHIGANTHILGSVSAPRIYLHENVLVDEGMHASEGVFITPEGDEGAEVKPDKKKSAPGKADDASQDICEMQGVSHV